jgi:hypothetical protein
MGQLPTNERNALPDTAFGLPQKRAYPMPDASHARNAKARATEEFNLGNLTSAEVTGHHPSANNCLTGHGALRV